MKNLRQSNFNVQKKDIFTTDIEGNLIYKIFNFGKVYIVNDVQKQNKLLDIESFKPFLLSLKPPIMIPIIIFSFIISLVMIFIFKFDYDIKAMILGISLVIYLISVFLFYTKIYMILRD